MILSAHLGTGLQDRNKLPKAVPNACFTGDSKLLFLRRGEMRRTTVPRQVNTWDLNIGAVPPSRPGRPKRGGTVLSVLRLHVRTRKFLSHGGGHLRRASVPSAKEAVHNGFGG